jgi:hypothetical protein
MTKKAPDMYMQKFECWWDKCDWPMERLERHRLVLLADAKRGVMPDAKKQFRTRARGQATWFCGCWLMCNVARSSLSPQAYKAQGAA